MINGRLLDFNNSDDLDEGCELLRCSIRLNPPPVRHETVPPMRWNLRPNTMPTFAVTILPNMNAEIANLSPSWTLILVHSSPHKTIQTNCG